MGVMTTQRALEEQWRRFLAIEQVAERHIVGQPLVRALLRTGEHRGIQIGGRGYLARLLVG